MNTYETIHEAYLGTLQDIYFNPDYRSAPRGLPCREKTDYTFRIRNPINEPIRTKDLERNRVIADYTRKEVELYDSCSNKVEDFAKASKFWEKLANPDGTVNSAYGYLIWKKKSHGNSMFEQGFPERDPNLPGVLLYPNPSEFKDDYKRTPWEWAKESLIADKDTRQAIVRFSLPEHQWIGNKDQTCTMHANFLIRDDKLNLSVVMRSNDMWLGLTYDLPWFVSLIDRMVDELKPHYPNLTKGVYTHTVHSLHVYERDAEKIHKALGYGYEGP
jgi:thymidylate synthase